MAQSLTILSVWVYIINKVAVHGIVHQDQSVLLKNTAEYKIDLVINDDDFEMIDKSQLNDFDIEEWTQDLRLHKITSKVKAKKLKSNKVQNAEGLTKHALWYSGRDRLPASPSIAPVTVTKYKDEYIIILTDKTPYSNDESYPKVRVKPGHAIHKRDVNLEEDSEYNKDYNDLINEYFEETDKAMKSNKTYHVSGSDVSQYGLIKSLKTIFLLKSDSHNSDIGFHALKCVLRDCGSQRHLSRTSVERLWTIVKVWFLIYLAVAVPLWCTRGWCCCCLFCKFFKPRQTIDEAKKYVSQYPPGIYRTKNGEIRYEPTEREMEVYEEFQHFIKTL